MQHQRAQYRVELTVRKRRRLDRAVSEDDLKTGLGRLLACSCEHLRRSVNAVHGACRPLGCDCQASCAAADVKHRLAFFQGGEAENLLAKRPLAPESEQPDQKIVTCGRSRLVVRGAGCRSVVSVMSFSGSRKRTLVRIWSRLNRSPAEEHAAPIRAVMDSRPAIVRHLLPFMQRHHAMSKPPVRDRRIQKTRDLLHRTLAGSIREKPYDAISVKEILDRADVGRSTFYTHYRDKTNCWSVPFTTCLPRFSRTRPRQNGPNGCSVSACRSSSTSTSIGAPAMPGSAPRTAPVFMTICAGCWRN